MAVELKQVPVLWDSLPSRFILHKDKIPISPSGHKVNPHDVTNHMDYQTAANYARRLGYGVGFSMPEHMASFDYDKIYDSVKQTATWAEQSFKYVPNSYGEYSPSGTGLHLWYFLDKDAQEYIQTLKKQTTIQGEQKFELIRRGFYVTITNDAVPMRPYEIATINKSMLTKLMKFIEAKSERGDAPADEVPKQKGPASDDEITTFKNQSSEGITYNDPLFKLAWNLTYRGGTFTDVVSEITDVFDLSPRKDEAWAANYKKIASTVERCVKYHHTNGVKRHELEIASLECTERVAAQTFSDQHERLLYHTREFGWLIWENDRFEYCGEPRVFRIIGDTLIPHYQLFHEQLQSDDSKKVVKKFIKQLHGLAITNNIAKLCQAYRDSSISEFDADLCLLNTPTGVVDFKQRALRPHNPELKQTQLTNASYQPNAHTPVFDDFLKAICLDNMGLVDDMISMMAYCLTGITFENLFFVLYGEGGNGKSTLINIFKHILYDAGALNGSYFDTWSAENIELRANQNSVDYAVAKARSARLVICPEVGKNKLNNARIKMLTGNDPISGRAIYRAPFTFVPQFKMMLITNAMPKVDPDDYAMVRRARLIPFLAKFVDHPRLPHERKRDRLIEEKLKGESDGIMTKLCHRAFDIVQEGRLKPPSQDTLRATKAWFNEIDPIKAFIDECVEYVPEKRVSTRELWEAFRTFCLINNERSALTQRAFVERIKTKLEKECHRVQYKGEKQFVFDGMKLSEKALQDNRGEF